MAYQVKDVWGSDMLRMRVAGEHDLEGFAPSAPLHEEGVYRTLMERGLFGARGESVLVMGMTVVVRRVANRLSSDVTVIDVNDQAIRLLKPAIATEHGERVLCRNWFNLPESYEGRADVIVGDGIFSTMQSHGDAVRLLARIKDTLADDGAVVLRTMVIPEDFDARVLTADAILENYRSGEFSDPEFGFAMRFWGFFNDAYDANNRMLDSGLAFGHCEELVRTDVMLREELDVMSKTYYTGKNYLPPVRVWEGMLADAGFRFERVELGGKHWFHYFPLYYCEGGG